MGGPGHRDSLKPPPALVHAVRSALRPLPEGVRVVLGVSGGADSIGMAWLVTAARPDLAAAVVHVRHGLRDDAADAQAAIATARALGLGWRVVAVDVVATRTGPEDAARRQRMTALARAALQAGAGAVLLAHTADDQAETVLLNIARGSGLPGLAGIPAWRSLTPGVALGHPLLQLRRADVRDVTATAGVPVVSDPTNDDPAQRRARARHTLLPQLAGLTGADTDPVVALARLARHARRDTAALDAMAAQRLRDMIGRWGTIRTVPTAQLDALPSALSTRVLRSLLAPGQHMPTEATVTAAARLRDGQALSLPGGGTATRGGGYLAVSPVPVAALPDRVGDHRIELPEVGVAVVRRVGSAARAVLPPWSPGRAAATVACQHRGALRVRSRRPGDRITTAVGTQKLSAAMAAAGVPRVARDLVPVIEDEAGVIWVPGVAVRAGTTGPTRLHLTPSPGQ